MLLVRALLLGSTLAAGLFVGGTPRPARAADDTYEVKSAPAKATVGVKTVTTVTIATKNGWHVNEEAPVTVKLAPTAGITVEKATLTKADVAQRTKDLARFDVAFTAAEPGRKTITGEARFVVCQESACRPIKEPITLALDVSPALAAAPAPAKTKKSAR